MGILAEDIERVRTATDFVAIASEFTGKKYNPRSRKDKEQAMEDVENWIQTMIAGIPKMNEPTSLMVHIFSLSGKTVALLHSGRLGELMRIVRSGREMAEKNGNPWIFVFREAWLRTVVLDFDGARRLCDTIADTATAYLPRQLQTIARLAAGYAELERGHHDDASRYFEQILDPAITPKFFLHWYWRMNAQLGLSNVWLAAGRLGRARTDADRFLASALSTAEPNLHALGWDMQARVSMAEKNGQGAEKDIEQGLAVLIHVSVELEAARAPDRFGRFLCRHRAIR